MHALVVNFRDVTERREGEEALRESNRQLQEALSELQRAQSALLQQERLGALGQVASGIAHDLNNALAPVVGFSELLLEHPQGLHDPAKVEQYLTLIHAGAEDAASVVGRMREFYRPREEDEPFTAVDVNHLATQTVRLSEPKWRDQAQAAGKTIVVQTDLQPVPPVLGHEAEIREALTNVLFNAVDATKQGGITVRTRSISGNVVLEVIDTGVGMPEAVRQRCLEPFFTTKGAQGSGLGLAMVFGTMRRHEGTLEIDSTVGRGTTVRLVFPTAKEQEDGALARRGTKHSTLASRAGSPLQVLLVDDEPIVRQVTAAYLMAEGHTVTEAASGREALEYFRPGRFDLVVTDRAMPGMPGEQLAASIRDIAPTTRIVLLTGFGDLMRAAEETPHGVDLVLGKPMTLAKLRKVLDQLFPPIASPAAEQS